MQPTNEVTNTKLNRISDNISEVDGRGSDNVIIDPDSAGKLMRESATTAPRKH